MGAEVRSELRERGTAAHVRSRLRVGLFESLSRQWLQAVSGDGALAQPRLGELDQLGDEADVGERWKREPPPVPPEINTAI